MPSVSPNAAMPTTRWSLIARVQTSDAPQARAALEELCTQYHYPLYCFIRQRGWSHHDAEDALHDFFAKLLRLEAFDDIQQEKGRLRTFLLKSLQRFLINRHKSASRREAREVSVDDTRFTLDPKLEQRYQHEDSTYADTPDVVFDRQWCAMLLQRVLLQLQSNYSKRDKLLLFDTLQPVLLSGGSLRGHDAAALAATLAMTEGALRTALLRLLRDYRAQLEEAVRQTVTSKEEVEAEIAHLMSILNRG